MAYKVFDAAGRLQCGTNNAAAALVAACRLASSGCIMEADTWGEGFVRVARGQAECEAFDVVVPWDAAMLAASVAFASAAAYF